MSEQPPALSSAEGPKRPTVALLTLGCKLNQADSEAIARRLAAGGVRVVERLLELARASAEAFRRDFLGRTLPVLWEQEKDRPLRQAQDRGWQGLTANYIRVYTSAGGDLPAGRHGLANRLLPTRLRHLDGEGVAGAPAPALALSR